MTQMIASAVRACRTCRWIRSPGWVRAGLIALAATLLAACVQPVQLLDDTGGGAGGTGASPGDDSTSGSASGDALPPPADPNTSVRRGSVRATFCDEFIELRDLPEKGDRSVYRAASGEDFRGWRSRDEVTLSTDGRRLTETDSDRTVTATRLGSAASSAIISGFQFNHMIIFLSDGSSYRVEIEDALTVRSWRLSEPVLAVQPLEGSLYTLIHTSRCETVRAQR